jgi:hypothetical protein
MIAERMSVNDGVEGVVFEFGMAYFISFFLMRTSSPCLPACPMEGINYLGQSAKERISPVHQPNPSY